MANFYADENFPRELVEALETLGYNLLTARGAGQANRSISDLEVLKFALARGRVVITLNREDFIALHREGQEHNGIVICKEDRDYRGQALALHEFLVSDNRALSGRLIRVKKQNQPGQAAPIFVVQEY